jgi:CHASE2 domain-containing sensor protein/tRNA A-37 threonylcarbamoyl transferase component Bud32
LTPERHERIQELFWQALGRPEAELGGLLAHACEGDTALRAEVESLLAAHAAAADFLERPALALPPDGLPLEGPETGSSRPAWDPDGQTLVGSKYRLLRRLGQGGMGSVYEALHVGLKRRVALKLIRPEAAHSPQFLARFQREAETLGRLEQPEVVGVLDYGVDTQTGGQPYLVMEYLEGQDLARLCRQLGALPVERALPLLEAVARGIDAVHAQGILHRDLKSANVLVVPARAAAPEQAKLIDFGIARLEASLGLASGSPASTDEMSQRLTQAGGFLGTPSHSAPEILAGGEATRSSDLYSFGILAHEVLVGALPVKRDPAGSRFRLPSSCNPDLPPELDAALLAPLAPDPAHRPQQAAELVLGLREAWQRARLRQWRSRQRPIRLGLAAGVALLAVWVGSVAGGWSAVAGAEARLLDVRFAWSSAREPDPRVALVVLDDAAVGSETSLAERADEIAAGLQRLFHAGARGVALDVLGPVRWARSRALSDVILRNADSLTLAALSDAQGKLVGPEALPQLAAVALGPVRAAELFGYVNLEPDPDGILRRARALYDDRKGRRWPAWAGRAVRTLMGPEHELPDELFLIDASVDTAGLTRLAWSDLASRLEAQPALVQDKLVLVGAEYSGAGDLHRLPAAAASQLASGLRVQATIVQTLLQGAPLQPVPAALALAALGAAACALAAAGLGLASGRAAWLVWLAAPIGYLAAAFALFRWTRLVLPMASALVAMAAAAAAAAWLRRRLTPRPGPEVLRAGAFAILALTSPGAALAEATEIQGQTSMPVAVIAELEGTAFVALPPDAPRRPAELFDWLPVGTQIDIGPEARMTLAWLDGRRYELTGGAAARIEEAGLETDSAGVRLLESVAPLPDLAPIRDGQTLGQVGGAISVRQARIGGLYPCEGVRVLAGAAMLRFAPDAAAGTYHVRIDAETGETLWQVQTTEPQLIVPEGLLSPGSNYAWHVRTLDRIGEPAAGQAQFGTLGEREAEARERLRLSALRLGDTAALALLGEVDRRLGLLAEARDALRAAHQKSPNNAHLKAVLQSLEAQLAAAGD